MHHLDRCQYILGCLSLFHSILVVFAVLPLFQAFVLGMVFLSQQFNKKLLSFYVATTFLPHLDNSYAVSLLVKPLLTFFCIF